MRIGLLTFHFPINYGALLQTFALNKTLKDFGHKVEIINYYSREHKSKYNFYQIPKTAKNFIYYFIKTFFLIQHIKKVNKLKRFVRQNLRISSRINTLENIELNYDVIITGSDQVFNLNFPDRLNYFLPCIKKKGQKKIAYAPSFGSCLLDHSLKNRIIDLVRDYDHISCREKDGTNFLEEIVGRNVEHVLDPVFLLSLREWSSLASPNLLNEEYILIYDLNGRKALIDIAQRIRGNNKIVIITNNPIAKIQKEYKGVDVFIQTAGIEDFISLIKFSYAVVTDSFHGIAMSIILKKQFFGYIALQSASSRIISLLNILSLEGQLINDINDEVKYISNQTFEVVQIKLSNLIEKSKLYLKNALK